MSGGEQSPALNLNDAKGVSADAALVEVDTGEHKYVLVVSSCYHTKDRSAVAREMRIQRVKACIRRRPGDRVRLVAIDSGTLWVILVGGGGFPLFT